MAVRLRVEPYDPDAIDADGDGIVQEGTAWERPVGTRLISELGQEIQRGMTSMSRPSMQVLDRNGTPVKYTPRYGGVSRQAGQIGKPAEAFKIPTLADMGIQTLEQILYPETPAQNAVPELPRPVPAVRDIPSGAPKPKRQEGLVQLSVDPRQYEAMREGLLTKVLAKHLPEEKRNLPARQIIDDISKSIGLNSDRDWETQLDDAIFYLQNDVKSSLDTLMGKIEVAGDIRSKERAQIVQRNVEGALGLMDTPQGTEILKERISQNYLDILSSMDAIYEKYPSLSKNIWASPYQRGDRKVSAGGYANLTSLDGSLIMSVQFNPMSLIMDDTNSENASPGELWDSTVRIFGVDDYQHNLAIHELGHHAHFSSILKRYGFDTSSDKSIVEQLKASGETLGSSHIGFDFALAKGINPTTRIDDLNESDIDKLNEYVVWRPYAIRDRTRLGEQSTFDTLDEKLRASGVGSVGDVGNLQKILLASSAGDSLNKERWQFIPDELQTAESMNEWVRSITGLDSKEFIEALFEAKSSDHGIDMRTIGLGGLSPDEVRELLASVSIYADSSTMESVAEGFAVLDLIERVDGINIAEADRRRIQQAIDKILGGLNEPVRIPKISDKSQQLMNSLLELLNSPVFKSLQEAPVYI